MACDADHDVPDSTNLSAHGNGKLRVWGQAGPGHEFLILNLKI